MSTFIFNFQFLRFCSRYLPDRPLIFTKSSRKCAAIETLSYWFLNTFGDARKVQKGHFRFAPTFTKCNVAAKRI